MIKNLYMEKVGIKAKIATKDLSNLDGGKRNAVLKQFYIYLKKYRKKILKANSARSRLMR